jgi:hypothetical protein
MQSHVRSFLGSDPQNVTYQRVKLSLSSQIE